MPVFIDVDRQIHQLLLFIEILRRHRSEVDIAPRSVKLLQIIETGAQFRFVEDLAGHQAQNGLDGILIELASAGDFHVADFVLIVFLDFECDPVAIDLFFPEWERNPVRQRRLDQR